MLEIKVTVEAQDLASAINNLATALGKHETAEVEAPKRKKAANPTPAPVPQPTAAPATTPDTVEPAAPAIPSVPAVAPVTNAVPQIPVPPAPQAYAAPAPQQPYVAPAVPTSAPQYSLDMIATAGSRLIDAGKMDQLMGVLAKYGAVSLTDINPVMYGAIATDLRALGAAI